jgi:hypothetical protein
MLKLTVALLALALAGTAGAEGWRSLRVDGSSEDAFGKSLAAFKEKLSPARRYVLSHALRDIWIQGTKAAEAAQGEYTAADYFRQVDGLGYEDVVLLADPTGQTAQQRYRDARHLNAQNRGSAGQNVGVDSPAYRQSSGQPSWLPQGQNPESYAQGQQACGCTMPGGGGSLVN